MIDLGYNVPNAVPVLRRESLIAAWSSIGLCLASLAFPWNNIVTKIQPTGLTTPPIVTQEPFYGIFMPHGWMLVGLMIWLMVFLLHVRKIGAAWLDTQNGRFSRTVLMICLLGLAVLIIQAFVYGVQQCRSCPQSVIGWGIYGVLMGLPLAAASLWRLRTF